MATITANVRIKDVTYDASGPLLAILFEALNEHGKRPTLTGYVCGPAAAAVWKEFVPGSDASIELELCLGMDFGRLMRFGIRCRHPMVDIGKAPQPCLPFANREEYKTIKYLHVRKIETTVFAVFRSCSSEDHDEKFDGSREGNEGNE